ncbi:MAG TPA: ATP-dependent zinc metalloprotease FtsH [Acidimicrobiales bacterium]|nr:ATP-dependent zinc metalloprotease FtsH [Acidimicrobiales bacterium]
MKKVLRSPIAYVLLAGALLLLAINVFRGGSHVEKLSLNTFTQDIADGKIASATLHDSDSKVTGRLAAANGGQGDRYQVTYPERYAPQLTQQLIDHKVPQVTATHTKGSIWVSLLLNFLPIVLLFGGFLFILNTMQGGGSRVMQFGKAKAKTVSKDQPKVTFADVAGADEAVAELQEIKEFLASPAKFHAIGAKIPKGVLLFGPPGTGKTLLARAVAGEAGVPFFSISGSDFVEMFVGVGASRVRDLFEQAKANAPAIIFMDEIDAVGRHRGAGLGGGHDEREQTLNQLLVEMDGFDVKGGIILIAATNRPDILDPALLRPGRFDRQIVVDRPDLAGRRAILGVHARGKPLGTSVSLETLARRTPGFTGADLANLLNEAALLTARHNLERIGTGELEEAIDRVIAGPERKTLVMSEKEKLVTAYHEGGHVIVGHVLPHADAIHKVSIVARSRSLGLTFTLPEDKFNHSRSELRQAMAMCLGGRTAEELIFEELTTGAENDIEKATRIARAMVTEYGMSDLLGPQQLGQKSGEVFLGRDFGHQPNYSEHVAASIDAEVRRLIDDAHEQARDILTLHRDTLDALAAALVDKETLDTPELMEIIGALPAWPPDGPGGVAGNGDVSTSNGAHGSNGSAVADGNGHVANPRTKAAEE